jgi:hypothetical protein
MADPLTYKIDFGLASLVVTVSDDRLTSKGPMQNLDIPLSALRHFCVAPIPNDTGNYDAQLVLAWDEGGKQKSKKLNVRGSDTTLKTLLDGLAARRPGTSLMHLDPAAAQTQMGVLSTNKLAWIIVLVMLGAIFAAIAIGVMLEK